MYRVQFRIATDVRLFQRASRVLCEKFLVVEVENLEIEVRYKRKPLRILKRSKRNYWQKPLKIDIVICNVSYSEVKEEMINNMLPGLQFI